jgi:hypothetical protein
MMGPSPSGGSLAAQGVLGLSARIPIQSAWFNQQAVQLDGFDFKNCRFDSCTLSVASVNFSLEGCLIDDDTSIIFGGATIKLIQLFNARYEWFFQNLPAFAPVRNPDGTITIGP